MNNQNTVVLCWRSGGDFTFKDVELLSKHLHKQRTGELRILVITNTVSQPVELMYCTLLPAANKEWPGWWTKMNMFAPDMEQYRPFLYLDLDTAVVNSLDGILPPTGHEDKFICLGGFFRPDTTNGLQSGLMWFPKNSKQITQIWNQWCKNPEGFVKTFQNRGGDQGFIRSVLGHSDIFWQTFTNKITSFKISVEGNRILTKLPSHISIVCFHGQPRIPRAGEMYDWVRDYVQDHTLLRKKTEVYALIPEAWVINLDHRPDRLEAFQKQNFPFHIERFSGIIDKDGEVGCKKAHLGILTKQHKFPFVVFEDDCQLINDCCYVDKAMQQLPENWDMLYVGANLQEPLERYSENLFHLHGAWCAHAIIYNSQRVVDYIVENKDKKAALDDLCKTEVEKKFNCFVVYPMVAIQRGSNSNVVPGYRDYRKLLEDNFAKHTSE
jgi:hypothetical protein